MPLDTSGSKASVGKNIGELTAANANRSKPRPRKQIIAIALNTLREHGGKYPRKK